MESDKLTKKTVNINVYDELTIYISQIKAIVKVGSAADFDNFNNIVSQDYWGVLMEFVERFDVAFGQLLV